MATSVWVVCLSDSSIANAIAGRFVARSHGETTGHSQFDHHSNLRFHSIHSPCSSLHAVFIRCPIALNLPLMIILDADAAVEQQKSHSVPKIKPTEKYDFPIELLYSRIIPRLYLTIEQYVEHLSGSDIIIILPLVYLPFIWFLSRRLCSWTYICRSPDWNPVGFGILLVQIGILICPRTNWDSNLTYFRWEWSRSQLVHIGICASIGIGILILTSWLQDHSHLT